MGRILASLLAHQEIDFVTPPTAAEQTSAVTTSDSDVARIRRAVSRVVDRALSGSAATGSRSPDRATPAAAPGRARWVEWGDAALRQRSRRSSGPGFRPQPRGGKSGKPVVALGSDHGAFRLKQQLLRYLEEELGYPVIDCGTDSEDSVDYPDIARDVALAVSRRDAWRGIVLDAMGIGSGMAANRVAGVLCAVCHDVATVRNAREHNDANVLSFGSRIINPGQARQLVRTFLTTEHAGGRHARRVAKIHALQDLNSTAP